MANENSSKKHSCKYCGVFCDKVSALVKDAKEKYDGSDKATKKKIIFGIAAAGAILSGLLKSKKKK